MCEFDSEVVDVNTDCVIAGWTNMQEEEPCKLCHFLKISE